jgi:sec-independent protein translocase protein TatA
MGPEWWIVLAVVVLIFGASQLPKLARSLGQAQKEFKKGLTDSASAEGDKEGEKPASS